VPPFRWGKRYRMSPAGSLSRAFSGFPENWSPSPPPPYLTRPRLVPAAVQSTRLFAGTRVPYHTSRLRNPSPGRHLART